MNTERLCRGVFHLRHFYNQGGQMGLKGGHTGPPLQINTRIVWYKSCLTLPIACYISKNQHICCTMEIKYELD
jgi:hypothetical protein